MTTQIIVPDIGDFDNVEIIEILAHPGDEIKKNDAIVTLESDKSSVEVPSLFAGKITELKVKLGDKVSKGSVLAILEEKKIENKNDNNKKEEIKKTTTNQKQADVLPETEKIITQAESSIIKETKKQSEKKVYAQPHSEDIDSIETQEWLDSLDAVVKKDGIDRAHYLLKKLIDEAYKEGSNQPLTRITPYINTIPVEAEIKSPGDQNIERRIRSLIRWNAAAMVVRANKKNPELGGHIGTFASAATLYDVGMNHFWRAKNNKFGGDLIYFQGHSAPGMYARAFLEGRFICKSS